MEIWYFKSKISVRRTNLIQDTIPQSNNIAHIMVETIPIMNKTMNMEAILIQLYKVNCKSLYKNWSNN